MRQSERPAGELYGRESYLAICNLDHNDPTELRALRNALIFWHEQLDQSKWPRALNWFRNHAFLAGNHYPNFRWNGTSVDFHTPTMPNAKINAFIPRMADDKITRPLERIVSLMIEHDPIPRVESNSDSPEDEDAARVGELFLGLEWPRIIKDRLITLGYILGTQGTAAVETLFDDLGEFDITPQFRDKKIDSEIEGEDSIFEQVPTGRDEVTERRGLTAALYDSYNLQPDPGATSEQGTLTWISKTVFADIGEVKEKFDRSEEGYYPEVIENIRHTEGTHFAPLYWRERVKDLLDNPETAYGLTSYTYNTEGAFAPGMTLLRTFDCKPNRRFPKGRTIMTAGDQIVYVGQSRVWSEKYPGRWHPYSIFRFWELPGRWWGIPLLSKIVPLQKRINAIDALVEINRRYMTIGQWLKPKQSNVPDGMLSGYPGQEIPYTATASGVKPEKVQHEPMPGELFAERTQLVESIDDIASTRELNKIAPSGMRAASMMEFGRREGLRSKASFLSRFEMGLELIAQNMLIETSIHMDEENESFTAKIQRAARDHSSLAVNAFSGASLLDNTDVSIDIVTEIMRSPEAKQDRMVQWSQSVGPNMTPAERAISARILGFDEFDQQNTPHYNRARKLVARVLRGEFELTMIIPTVDNAAIFAEVFREELLGDQIYDLPEEIFKELHDKFLEYQMIASQDAESARMKEIQMTALMARAQQGILPGQRTTAEAEPGPGQGLQAAGGGGA